MQYISILLKKENVGWKTKLAGVGLFESALPARLQVGTLDLRNLSQYHMIYQVPN
ncbi:6036_t:CDS:2 [Ambispora leptoticha]|uniref:6036_t:CDS:1 n=1 Tax=Ambispora leptoticha TaxID=144679 RepID=A0A9N9FWQ8_9GLOM|nr:6036_t:CDS:2 [Ambispora leptoticha]